jgi:hypothetical protein
MRTVAIRREDLVKIRMTRRESSRYVRAGLAKAFGLFSVESRFCLIDRGLLRLQWQSLKRCRVKLCAVLLHPGIQLVVLCNCWIVLVYIASLQHYPQKQRRPGVPWMDAPFGASSRSPISVQREKHIQLTVQYEWMSIRNSKEHSQNPRISLR